MKYLNYSVNCCQVRLINENFCVTLRPDVSLWLEIWLNFKLEFITLGIKYQSYLVTHTQKCVERVLLYIFSATAIQTYISNFVLNSLQESLLECSAYIPSNLSSSLILAPLPQFLMPLLLHQRRKRAEPGATPWVSTSDSGNRYALCSFQI